MRGYYNRTLGRTGKERCLQAALGWHNSRQFGGSRYARLDDRGSHGSIQILELDVGGWHCVVEYARHTYFGRAILSSEASARVTDGAFVRRCPSNPASESHSFARPGMLVVPFFFFGDVAPRMSRQPEK